MAGAGENLSSIVIAWTALLRTGSTGELASILDDRVVWQGLLPHLVCSDRDQVLGLLARNRPRPPRLTRIEAQEFGDRVAVSVEGPDFPPNDVLAAGAPRSLVFTFRDGKVVRMESLASRDAAFEVAVSDRA